MCFILAVLVVSIQARVKEADFEGSFAGETRLIKAMSFCWCPKGEFTMGSPITEPERDEDESQVKVQFTSGFWMGQFEATQFEWKRIMLTEPWSEKIPSEIIDSIPELPAVNIRYTDAIEFCNKLSRLLESELPLDWRVRIPTEAQWEYACRSGNSSTYCYGNDPFKLIRYCHFGGENFAPIRGGSKLWNSWNIRDMHGNVKEWCLDTYRAELSSGRDPSFTQLDGDKSHIRKVVRGGDFASSPKNCRSANRGWEAADFVGASWPTITTGLRVSISKFKEVDERVNGSGQSEVR